MSSPTLPLGVTDKYNILLSLAKSEEVTPQQMERARQAVAALRNSSYCSVVVQCLPFHLHILQALILYAESTCYKRPYFVVDYIEQHVRDCCSLRNLTNKEAGYILAALISRENPFAMLFADAHISVKLADVLAWGVSSHQVMQVVSASPACSVGIRLVLENVAAGGDWPREYMQSVISTRPDILTLAVEEWKKSRCFASKGELTPAEEENLSRFLIELCSSPVGQIIQDHLAGQVWPENLRERVLLRLLETPSRIPDVTDRS